MHKVLLELENRGLINQSTDIEVLSKLLESGSAVYCGFDPTADSLHVGSLLPLTVLKLLKDNGVPIVALIGGGTGRIGDPSFKASERSTMAEQVVEQNIVGIEKVIKSVLGDGPLVTIANNHNWMKEINMLDFLRTYGKCFTVNNMINKESVRSRIERPDQGISFTEFSYPILQGLDFEYLFSVLDCKIQIGGSDQWGNMIAGTDIIHKLHGNDAECGVITMPLVTKADGTKFGKSENGTVWLNPNKTTAYHYFQFWLNLTDEETIKMYQYFKPLSFSLQSIENEMKVNPTIVKKQFAMAMTSNIHGSADTAAAVSISEFLHGKSTRITSNVIDMMIDSGYEVLDSTESWDLVSLLVDTGLANSRKMAREFMGNGAVKINGIKVSDFYDANENEFTKDVDFMNNKHFILQRGKNHMIIVKNLES